MSMVSVWLKSNPDFVRLMQRNAILYECVRSADAIDMPVDQCLSKCIEALLLANEALSVKLANYMADNPAPVVVGDKVFTFINPDDQPRKPMK